MKLDPGMHIGLHLVFFGKTGVTTVIFTVLCRPMARQHKNFNKGYQSISLSPETERQKSKFYENDYYQKELLCPH
jgi:hypothetical protein